MRKAIVILLFVCCLGAGCYQERLPQTDLQTTESASQALDHNPPPNPNSFVVSDKSTPQNPNRFVGRDGIAEARAAIAAGERPKLYMHIFNGVAPGWATPGIANFQPWSRNVVSFQDIPEMAWSEGGARNPPEPPNARPFATDFNKTMYEAYERQTKKVCPKAKVI